MTLTANRLLRGGVRVYLFPAMTHVKAMSADGVWAYIGTGNFDELSLRNNREVGLSVTGARGRPRARPSLFLPDMAVSRGADRPPAPAPQSIAAGDVRALVLIDVAASSGHRSTEKRSRGRHADYRRLATGGAISRVWLASAPYGLAPGGRILQLRGG